MSITQTMSISRQSMMNNQAALAVVSHNIANTNTPGYARRRCEFAEDTLVTSTTSLLSTIRGLNGAQINGLQSYADSMINTSIRKANSESAYFNELKSMLDKMGAVTDELDEGGLQQMFSEFFSAAQHLSKYPTDSAARQDYIQRAKNITYKFNSIANTLENQRSDICGNYLQTSTLETSKIAIAVNEVNSKLEQIARINNSILDVGAENGNALALIDQRNIILDELSNLIPIKVLDDKSGGTVTVMLDDIRLVSGTKVEQKLAVTTGTTPEEPVVLQIENVELGIKTGVNINSIFGSRGQIGAMLDMVTDKGDGFISINTLMGRMDILANAFAQVINDMQTYSNGDMKACYLVKDTVSGEVTLAYNPPPPPMFTGTGAADIKVSDEILQNHQLVTTARVNTDASTNTNWWLNVGNSDNMLLIAELRTKNIVDTTGLGLPPDNTLEGYLTATTTKVGTQGQDIIRKADIHNNAANVLADQRSSLIGVNLDEELADMIKFQRAYEASARIFAAADEILKTLVNLGRY